MFRARHYFLAGLLSGVALGAVVMLLFAPLSGWETRRLLAEKGQSLKAEAEEVAPAMQRGPTICIRAMRRVLYGLLLLARGDVEKLWQGFGLGSKWLVIG